MKKNILWLVFIIIMTFSSVKLYSLNSRLVETKFYSKSLGRSMPIALYLPYPQGTKQKEKYPVIYMLHGLSDHYNTWEKVAKIKELIDSMILSQKIKKVIVVFPEGEDSYYYNSSKGRFEDYIVKDVVSYVEKNYPVLTSRKNRAILGISMGGAGAMRLALKYPQLFCCVFGLSGIYHPDYMRSELSALSVKRLDGLRIFFWAGDNDSARQYGYFLNKLLSERGIKHFYKVMPGKHDWPQWIPEIKKALSLFVPYEK